MSQKNEDTDLTKSLGNLFEDEIGKSNDAPLFDCPHCEHPVTKSEVLAKAKGIPSGIKLGGKKTDVARQQNNASGEGAHARYGNAPKPHDATKRSGKKVAKTSPAYPKTMAAKKSEGTDDASDDESVEAMPEAENQEVSKSSTLRGTEYVQYYTDNSPSGDAAIAKMMAEGSIGQMPTQPIDKNHRKF